MAFLDRIGLERLWTHILAKLSAKADKTDLKQSNWNQNDSSEIDYIQNRPFYKEDTITPGVVFVDTSFTGTSTIISASDKQCYEYIAVRSNSTAQIDLPEIIKITFDGE